MAALLLVVLKPLRLGSSDLPDRSRWRGSACAWLLLVFLVVGCGGGCSSKPRFFSEEEVRSIFEESLQLQVGATDGEAIGLLGVPSIREQAKDIGGPKTEYLYWSMNAEKRGSHVRAVVSDGVVTVLDRKGGSKYENQEMASLMKKAQALRLGMTAQEVIDAMGTPSEKLDHVSDVVSSVDRVRQDFNLMKVHSATLSWHSTENAITRIIMVGLNNDALSLVVINQLGSGEVYKLGEYGAL